MASETCRSDSITEIAPEFLSEDNATNDESVTFDEDCPELSPQDEKIMQCMACLRNLFIKIRDGIEPEPDDLTPAIIHTIKKAYGDSTDDLTLTASQEMQVKCALRMRDRIFASR